MARLKFGGFRLLDAQFSTPHLEQFNAQTLPRRIFHALLGAALETRGDFHALPIAAKGADLIEIHRELTTIVIPDARSAIRNPGANTPLYDPWVPGSSLCDAPE